MMALSNVPRLGLRSQSPRVAYLRFACAQVIESPRWASPTRSFLAVFDLCLTPGCVTPDGSSLVRVGLRRLPAVWISPGTSGLRAVTQVAAPNSSPFVSQGLNESHRAVAAGRRAMTAKRCAPSGSPNVREGRRRLLAVRMVQGTSTLCAVAEATVPKGSPFVGSHGLTPVGQAASAGRLAPGGGPLVRVMTVCPKQISSPTQPWEGGRAGTDVRMMMG